MWLCPENKLVSSHIWWSGVSWWVRCNFCNSRLSTHRREASFKGSNHKEPCRWVSAASGTMVTGPLTAMINGVSPTVAEPRCTLNAAFYLHRSADCLSVESTATPNFFFIIIVIIIFITTTKGFGVERVFPGVLPYDWVVGLVAPPTFPTSHLLLSGNRRAGAADQNIYSVEQNLFHPILDQILQFRLSKYTQYCTVFLSSPSFSYFL